MSLLLEECSVLGVLVPTKAVLYQLILGTCEGSISHGFYDLTVRNCFKHITMWHQSQMNPTFTMVLQSWTQYDLFLVAQQSLDTKYLYPYQFVALTFIMMLSVGQWYPKVTKICPVKRSSISTIALII